MKFSREALRYEYNSRNIYDFLTLDIESLQVLVPESCRTLHRVFDLIISVGLGTSRYSRIHLRFPVVKRRE